MTKAKFYIRMDTYWQGSYDTFFGPYPTKEAAETALKDSGAGRWDLSQQAQDIKHQTRCLGILNTTEARKAGMSQNNTVPPQEQVPGYIEQLRDIEDLYLVGY